MFHPRRRESTGERFAGRFDLDCADVGDDDDVTTTTM
jgi:hypothetical protein